LKIANRSSDGGDIARAAQALAPRVALSFYFKLSTCGHCKLNMSESSFTRLCDKIEKTLGEKSKRDALLTYRLNIYFPPLSRLPFDIQLLNLRSFNFFFTFYNKYYILNIYKIKSAIDIHGLS